jgi:hypothetical protein
VPEIAPEAADLEDSGNFPHPVPGSPQVSASNPSPNSPTRRPGSPCSVWVGDGSDGCVGYSGNNIFDFDRWSRPPTIAVSGEKVMKSSVGTVAPDASEDSIASVFEKADVGGDALERGESQP